MAINRSTFEQILRDNVIECKNVRRHVKTGAKLSRRWFITNSPNILNSDFGRGVFNYRPPTKPRPYNPRVHNLIFVWDIFKQDYRAIACESVRMIQIFPATNPKKVEEFWIYVRDQILTMSRVERERFFNT